MKNQMWDETIDRYWKYISQVGGDGCRHRPFWTSSWVVEGNSGSAHDNVLYCTVCGNKLSYNDAYCNNCGAPNKLYGTLDEKSNTSGFEKNNDGSRSFKDVSTNAPVSSRKQMDLTLMAGLGLLLSILVPIFGIIMSVSSLQASKKVYADNPTMRVRIMILSICGIVFSITFWIYSMYINFTTDDESETETALLLLSLL